jgi:hypothetical protein
MYNCDRPDDFLANRPPLGENIVFFSATQIIEGVTAEDFLEESTQLAFRRSVAAALELDVTEFAVSITCVEEVVLSERRRLLATIGVRISYDVEYEETIKNLTTMEVSLALQTNLATAVGNGNFTELLRSDDTANLTDAFENITADEAPTITSYFPLPTAEENAGPSMAVVAGAVGGVAFCIIGLLVCVAYTAGKRKGKKTAVYADTDPADIYDFHHSRAINAVVIDEDARIQDFLEEGAFASLSLKSKKNPSAPLVLQVKNSQILDAGALFEPRSKPAAGAQSVTVGGPNESNIMDGGVLFEIRNKSGGSTTEGEGPLMSDVGKHTGKHKMAVEDVDASDSRSASLKPAPAVSSPRLTDINVPVLPIGDPHWERTNSTDSDLIESFARLTSRHHAELDHIDEMAETALEGRRQYSPRSLRAPEVYDRNYGSRASTRGFPNAWADSGLDSNSWEDNMWERLPTARQNDSPMSTARGRSTDSAMGTARGRSPDRRAFDRSTPLRVGREDSMNSTGSSVVYDPRRAQTAAAGPGSPRRVRRLDSRVSSDSDSFMDSQRFDRSRRTQTAGTAGLASPRQRGWERGWERSSSRNSRYPVNRQLSDDIASYRDRPRSIREPGRRRVGDDQMASQGPPIRPRAAYENDESFSRLGRHQQQNTSRSEESDT